MKFMEHKQIHIQIFLLVVFIFHLVICATSNSQEKYSSIGYWLNHGGNIYNQRYAEGETKISTLTAPNLCLKWEFYTGNHVTATPAIYKGMVYFPSWNGYIYAVKASDGSLVWKKDLEKLTGLNTTIYPIFNVTKVVSRTTPAIVENDMLIFAIYGPAYVIAVKRTTGNLIWKRQLDRHPNAIITMSGTHYKQGFYVGVSSIEETASVEDCCTFRGSFTKLDIHTGAILWRTYMLPDNNGKLGEYAGGAIWGSSPSIDTYRNHVYIATGNLYSTPEHIEECQERQNNQTSPTRPDACIEPDNHSNSMLALDLDSGEIKWYQQLGGYDVWFLACANSSTTGCPPGPNPDADFGEAPMMLSVYSNGSKLDIVAAVQKSGFAWALRRDNGSIVWSTEAGPGGIGGGGTWGSATDNVRIYTNIANSEKKKFTLLPSNKVINGGAWVTMDPTTGRILWSTAVPDNATTNPVTIANGVLFAGSTYETGPVYAINAKNGEILWSYETGASVFGGMSVSEGCIYVGNGYWPPTYTSGTSLFAFCVDY